MEVEGGWSYAEIASMTKFYRTYAHDVRKYGFHDNPILEINVDKIDLSNRIHMGYLFELAYEALTKVRLNSIGDVDTATPASELCSA